MESVFTEWCARVRARTAWWLTITGIAGLLLAVGAMFVPEALAGVLGGAGGLAWFAMAYGAWHTVLPEEWRERTNLRATRPYGWRRKFVLGAGLVWILILVVFGSAHSVLGALTVTVTATGWRVWMLTDADRAQLEAEAAAAEEAQPVTGSDLASGSEDGA